MADLSAWKSQLRVKLPWPPSTVSLPLPSNLPSQRRNLRHSCRQLQLRDNSLHHDQTPPDPLVADPRDPRRLRRLAGADARRLGLAARRGVLPGTADELVEPRSRSMENVQSRSFWFGHGR